MDKPLSELEDAVCDDKPSLEFVVALVRDREQSIEAEKQNPSSPYGPDAGGWENTSISSFLEAALAWAEASQFGRIPATNPWKRFTCFLHPGKIYEMSGYVYQALMQFSTCFFAE
jgi:hypothetical protein